MISPNIKTKLKEYFEVNEFKQLLEQLKYKYIRYGSCIGTISIKPKTTDEAIQLSKFLVKNIKENVKINIKISDIQKSLDGSIFEGIKSDELVLMFFPGIKSNKQIKVETDLYIDSLLNKYKDMYQGSNIACLFEHKEALKKIKNFILHDNTLLENIFVSLSELPIYDNNNESLAIFASKTTGNPHYYDLDTHNSNALLQFICYLYNLEFENNRDIKKSIFEKVGILIDEVSNYVITYNLGGNELLDVFKNNLTPLTINLSNIQKLANIKAENDTLLVLENPSFMSKINNKKIDFSVIITSGNSNLVIYKLLEKISTKKIYFNGDFDPEGLLIAQNFKNRYPYLMFIGYNEKYYQNGLSDNKINSPRLKKLNNIVDDDLMIIKNLLLSNKFSSYQEANYDMLLDDLRKLE